MEAGQIRYQAVVAIWERRAIPYEPRNETNE